MRRSALRGAHLTRDVARSKARTEDVREANFDSLHLRFDSLLDALGYLGLLNQAYNDLPFPRTVAER